MRRSSVPSTSRPHRGMDGIAPCSAARAVQASLYPHGFGVPPVPRCLGPRIELVLGSPTLKMLYNSSHAAFLCPCCVIAPQQLNRRHRRRLCRSPRRNKSGRCRTPVTPQACAASILLTAQLRGPAEPMARFFAPSTQERIGRHAPFPTRPPTALRSTSAAFKPGTRRQPSSWPPAPAIKPALQNHRRLQNVEAVLEHWGQQRAFWMRHLMREHWTLREDEGFLALGDPAQGDTLSVV